ncbi:MAG: serine hydrolase [Desulfamplus sp.]|nr:serine hydrolase [Desulfamplus sp.]
MGVVARRMQMAVNSRVFPGAVLLVSHKGKVVFHEAFGLADISSGQLMTKDSVFDLASLTKPLATALSIIKLVECGAICVDQRLGQILTHIPSDKASITVEQLLRHTSGLPAHRPFYKRVIAYPLQVRLDLMRKLVLKEVLVAKPGEDQIYSDLGYMLIAWIIEIVSGCLLDQFVQRYLYEPLGIKDLYFVRMASHKHTENRMCEKSIIFQRSKLFVSTEMCPWRKKVLRGEVHDDNAWSVGGVDGHAGLFGTASGVYSLLKELINLVNGKKSLLFSSHVLKYFLKKKEGENMVGGFDTPSLHGSSAGKYFSSESFGHLGFTGTSFWVDPLKAIIVVLLSNRVHPSRNNQQIKGFRPEIHDLVFETLMEL